MHLSAGILRTWRLVCSPSLEDVSHEYASCFGSAVRASTTAPGGCGYSSKIFMLLSGADPDVIKLDL